MVGQSGASGCRPPAVGRGQPPRSRECNAPSVDVRRPVWDGLRSPRVPGGASMRRVPRDELHLHREEAHPEELREARERAAGPLPARDAARLLPGVPAGGRAARAAQERGPAGGVLVDLPDLVALRQRAARVRQLLAAAAGVRRRRVPAARAHLLLRAARARAPDPDGQGGAEGDGEGGEGAGGLHGRDPAHDRQRLVHHQRHRTRDRLAAAPLAGRVLRARPRQDAQLRQAPVLGAGDPLPRQLARLRVRPEGLPVLPRRPAPQDAGDDAAQGDRPHQRADPRRVLPVRHVPLRQGRPRARARARAAARRDGEVRHRRQGRQGHRRQGQAHHRAPRARARRRRREEDRGPGRVRGRPHARHQRRRQVDRRGDRQGERRDHRGTAEESAGRRGRGVQHAVHERPRPGSVHLADAEERRHARPVRGQGGDLPHDAPGRAADRGRRRVAVPRPVLLRGALRPVGGRPDEVQPPRRPRGAEGHRHADQRGHHRGHPHPRRAAQRPRRDRRHRPPRQPPRALGRRARREPVPLRPRARRARGQGAPGPGREREPAAARPDQRQADLGGDQGVLRQLAAVAVHGPDQPAVRDHAQAARLGAGPGRPHARARGLRGPRRAPDALRPRVPDRDAGRPEHRPHQLARAVRAHQRVRLPRDAVPQGRRQPRRPTRSTTSRRSRKAST